MVVKAYRKKRIIFSNYKCEVVANVWERAVSYVLGHIFTFRKNPFNLYHIRLLNTSDTKISHDSCSD